jgi:hypothetical protein
MVIQVRTCDRMETTRRCFFRYLSRCTKAAVTSAKANFVVGRIGLATVFQIPNTLAGLESKE